MEPFTEQDETAYQKWYSAITQAPFCHPQAWQQLNWCYRPFEVNKFSRLKPVVLSPASEHEEIFKGIERYGCWLANSSLERLSTQDQWLNQTDLLPLYLTLYLYRLALSSPTALYQALRYRQMNLKSLPQNQTPVIQHSLPPHLIQALVLDEGYVFSGAEEAAECQLGNIYLQQGRGELRELDDLLAVVPPDEPEKDAKLAKLLSRVAAGDRKIIIFTHYRDTLTYLKRYLENFNGYRKDKPVIVSIDGSMDEANQQKQVHKFDQAKTGILLATDATSYRLRWQTTDYELFNYDLPWNSIRLGQRLQRSEGTGRAASFTAPLLDNTWEPLLLKNLCGSTSSQEDVNAALTVFNIPGAPEMLSWIGRKKSKSINPQQLSDYPELRAFLQRPLKVKPESYHLRPAKPRRENR